MQAIENEFEKSDLKELKKIYESAKEGKINFEDFAPKIEQMDTKQSQKILGKTQI